ncbi:transmembrane protein 208 isoform X2 [Wyeomyia smithii]|nr:transmembrane protein 208 isoform X2 [Wyeomyia smithii]
MCIATTVFCLIITYVVLQPSGILQMAMMLLSVCIYFGSYSIMMTMSKPRYSETGIILDSGNDLNMEGGIAEHIKDVIILTTGTQLLSLISDYFWFSLLLAPLRAAWILWNSIIKPWLNQKDEQQDILVNEKKHKLTERKNKRIR